MSDSEKKIEQLKASIASAVNEKVIAEERLKELQLELVSTRKDADARLHEAETLLEGFHVLTSNVEPEETFTNLLDVLKRVLQYEEAVVLRQVEAGSDLRPIVMTSDEFCGRTWQVRPFFERVFHGQPLAAFNVSMIPEWQEQAPFGIPITSAIHIAITTETSRALIIGTHSERGFFTMSHVEQAKRFSVMATQALQTIELYEKVLSERDSLEIRVQERTKDLTLAKEAAEMANHTKSRFLANMSHEIRTPLNAVISYAELLKVSHLNWEQMDLVETIHTSGITLLAIIKEILDFSKIEAGRMELDQTTFDLRTVVEESLLLFSAEAGKKQINLAYCIDRNTPTKIVADQERLRQILSNVLSNALKFTHEGEISLVVKAKRRKNRSKTQLIFSVKDTGIGIAAEDLDKLFQPFSQVDASTTRKYGGTGLGLAICKSLCVMMDGDISAISYEGHGSEFKFHVSVKEVEENTHQYLYEPHSEFKNKSVLLINEYPTNQQILKEYVRIWGMNPTVVQSVQDGLLIAQKRKFDLCIVGTKQVKHSIHFALNIPSIQQDVPIVVLHAISPSLLPNWKQYFADFLSTPIRPTILYQALLAIVNPRSASVSRAESRIEIDEPLFLSRPPTAEQCSILIAEDNEVNQKVMLKILERLGYGATVVSNGKVAVQAALSQSYDIILMDIQMPIMDGVEAMKTIRSKLQANAPQIIAVTAHALSGDREHYLRLGFDDYLAKPLQIDLFAQKIRKIQQHIDAHGIQKYPEGIDVEILLKQYESDAELFFWELLPIYIKDCADIMPKIETALANHDTPMLMHFGHRLKGSSSSIGAMELHDSFVQLENLAKKHQYHDIPALIKEINEQLERLSK